MTNTPHAESADHGYLSDKDRYLARLKRIEGQARGIHRMINDETYCIDILTQINPRPVPEVTLMQQRLRQRAKDPEANTYYQRYAAAGKHLARPEIEYCQLPPQTTTTQPNNDNNAVEHDHKNDTDHTPGPFYTPEPPPL